MFDYLVRMRMHQKFERENISHRKYIGRKKAQQIYAILHRDFIKFLLRTAAPGAQSAPTLIDTGVLYGWGVCGLSILFDDDGPCNNKNPTLK